MSSPHILSPEEEIAGSKDVYAMLEKIKDRLTAQERQELRDAISKYGDMREQTGANNGLGIATDIVKILDTLADQSSRTCAEFLNRKPGRS